MDPCGTVHCCQREREGLVYPTGIPENNESVCRVSGCCLRVNKGPTSFSLRLYRLRFLKVVGSWSTLGCWVGPVAPYVCGCAHTHTLDTHVCVWPVGRDGSKPVRPPPGLGSIGHGELISDDGHSALRGRAGLCPVVGEACITENRRGAATSGGDIFMAASSLS